jgi:hypothetical protein
MILLRELERLSEAYGRDGPPCLIGISLADIQYPRAYVRTAGGLYEADAPNM